MKPLLPRWRAVVLLAAFVAVALAAVPQAVINIVARGSLVSFDNPATQLFDELTGQKAPQRDPLFEAEEALRKAAQRWSRLTPDDRAGDRQAQVLGSIAARAPPSIDVLPRS